MKTVLAACATLVIVLTLLVSAQSPAPTGQPTTASGCLTATRAFQQARMKEAGTPLARDKYEVILAETKTFAKACLATLPLDTLPVAEQLPLANLYSESGQPDLAMSTLQKALEASHGKADEQGRLLVGMIRLVLRQPVSDSRNAAAEKLVDQVETLLPATSVRDRIEAHGALNSYYRADDIDAGIIRHSTRLIELNRALTPEQRVAPIANLLVAAYENLGEALAGQEQNDKALEVLRRAHADGERVFELGGEVLGWKEHWADRYEDVRRLEWPGSTWKGRLWSLARRARAVARPAETVIAAEVPPPT